MARSLNGSGDLLSKSSVDLSAYKVCTAGFWAKIPSFPSSGSFANLFYHDDSVDNQYVWYIITDWASEPTTMRFAFHTPGGGGAWSDQYNRPSTGVWHHWLYVANRGLSGSGMYINFYLDGVLQTPFNTSHSVFDYQTFGGATFRMMFGSQGGQFAEFALWGGLDAGGYAKSLAAGYSPIQVRPENLVAYLPLLGNSPEPDYSGNRRSFTVTGSTITAHPGVLPMMMGAPERRAYLTVEAPAGGGTVYTDTGTIRSKATFSIADTKQSVDTGTIRSVGTFSIADTKQNVDTGTIRSASSIASTQEGITHTDANTIRSAATFAIADTKQSVDTGTIRSVGTFAISDTSQKVDTGTIRSKATPTGVDTAQFVDAASIRSKGTFTIADTAQFVDAGSIQSKATFSISESTSSIYVDSGTIRSKGTFVVADTAQFVDAASIRSKGTFSIVEASSNAYTDSGTIRSKGTFSSVDVEQFLEANSVRSKATFLGADAAQFVDTGTIRPKGTFAGTEFKTITDAATARSVARLTDLDVALFIDARTIASVSRVASVEQYVTSGDHATISSITHFSGVEFSRAVIPATELRGYLYSKWYGRLAGRME